MIIGPSEAWALLWRPRIGFLLGNTGRLMISVVGLSMVLGVGTAWLIERSNLRWRGLWHTLMAAPLAIPAFVNGYGWVSLTTSVQTYLGATMIVTLSYYPLVYLPTVAMLRGLDPALEETAMSLGHTRWQVFWRVTLPQLRPAVLGGSLLVGLHLLAEYGAVQMLRFPTFTTAIYDQFKSSFNGPAANMIASVLVLACALLLTLELKLRGRRHYARVSHGVARPPERLDLGRSSVPVHLAMAALVALAIGVPTYSLVHWLIVGSSTSFPIGELAAATFSTLGLAASAAAVTTLFALPAAWLVVRHRSWIATVLERSTFTANALPGIVVALALVTVSIRVAQPLYQTAALLVLTYAIMFLPRAMVGTRAALEQAPPMLDDVSHSLGVSSLSTFRRVTLPLISPGLGASAALVFLAVATELTATLMLAPIDTTTLATGFWLSAYDAAYGEAAPYALLLVLISIPATALLVRESRSGRIST